MRGWNAAESTIRERMIIAEKFLAGRDLTAVGAADVSAWLSNPSYSAWTRVTYYGHLKALFAWAVETGRRPDNPVVLVRRPREPRDRPRPLTPEQMDLVLENATGRMRSWLLLAYYAGMRAHEIAKIRGQDVNERTIYIVGKGRAAALIPTHPVLWELAQEYPARGFWFPSHSRSGHVEATSVSHASSVYFTRLGIDGAIHRCRHSYATQMLRNGHNVRVVQTAMRHESLTSTAKYTEVGDDEVRAAIGSLPVTDAARARVEGGAA